MYLRSIHPRVPRRQVSDWLFGYQKDVLSHDAKCWENQIFFAFYHGYRNRTPKGKYTCGTVVRRVTSSGGTYSLILLTQLLDVLKSRGKNTCQARMHSITILKYIKYLDSSWAGLISTIACYDGAVKLFAQGICLRSEVDLRSTSSVLGLKDDLFAGVGKHHWAHLSGAFSPCETTFFLKLIVFTITTNDIDQPTSPLDCVNSGNNGSRASPKCYTTMCGWLNVCVNTRLLGLAHTMVASTGSSAGNVSTACIKIPLLSISSCTCQHSTVRDCVLTVARSLKLTISASASQR